MQECPPGLLYTETTANRLQQVNQYTVNAQRFIRQHYAEKLTLESIAAEVCLSPGYLSSLFKAEAGKSLFAYLNRFRVKRSQQLLLESNASLVDVAHACGFEDQSYFARVFKKYTGVSPGKYRQKKGRV